MRTYLLSTITTTYTWRQRNFYVEAKRTRTCEHIIIEVHERASIIIEVVCTFVLCTCSQVHILEFAKVTPRVRKQKAPAHTTTTLPSSKRTYLPKKVLTNPRFFLSAACRRTGKKPSTNF